jgi:hypothetical protein
VKQRERSGMEWPFIVALDYEMRRSTTTGRRYFIEARPSGAATQ